MSGRQARILTQRMKYDRVEEQVSGGQGINMNRINRFAWFSWGLLAYNLLVILWGAYVRATGSGAGCGAHWPLCNGQVIPEAVRAATWIEFTHRVMSGLTLAFAIGLAVWAWRSYNRGSPARLGASLVLFFTVTEALVGAGLVLFSLVEKNASVTRTISVAVHLTNTLLLLGAVTLTAWWASGGETPRIRGQGITGLLLVLGLVGIILVSASGAITALGDTLFPSGSLAEGVQQDFLPTAHFLIRLRIYHPVIAVLMGVYVTSVAVLTATRRPGRLIRQFRYRAGRVVRPAGGPGAAERLPARAGLAADGASAGGGPGLDLPGPAQRCRAFPTAAPGNRFS